MTPHVYVHTLVLLAVLASVGPPLAAQETPTPWTIDEVVDIEPVWSGHRVGFSLLTDTDTQYVAFYDAERRMTIGSRDIKGDSWQLVRLPSRLVWDSHNYITMALDSRGQLHVSGNMHCVPLIYFRTSVPGDIGSLEQVETMVGPRESTCTYPRFLRDAEGRLVFTYRDGRSGNGSQVWNILDARSGIWSRLLDEPLFSGEGKMNAYFNGPIQSPDGTFHVCWVWRDTPDCATNHDLCYARSCDLVHWVTSDGQPLELPITIETAEIVDPVPAGGGIINGNVKVGFDTRGNAVLSYHKYDAQGKTQVYNARREADGWQIRQVSDWDFRWEFSGGGSIPFEVSVGAVTSQADGTLTQSFGNAQDGSGNWLLDEANLTPTGKAPRTSRMPPEIARRELDWPGMQVRTTGDLGDSGSADIRYLLRHEARTSNRDRPYPGEIPPPSMLRLYRLVR